MNLDRPETERLWGVTLDDALDRLRRSPDPSLLESNLADEVVGRRIRVRGRIFPDDFGLNMYPEAVEPVRPDLARTVERLNGRWTGGPRGAP